MPVTPSQTNRFSNDCTDLVSQPQVPIRTLFLLWERSSAALATPGWMIGPCPLGNPAPPGGPGTARVSGSKLHVTAVAHGVQPGSAHAVRMPWPASGIGEPEDLGPPLRPAADPAPPGRATRVTGAWRRAGCCAAAL